MPRFDVDLLVAGGGPAGLATALHARRAGMSVAVVEPRQPPVDKACGEGLMPGGLAELKALGVDPAGMAMRGIAYLDGRGRRVEAAFATGPGRGVRRTTLHDALCSQARDVGVQWVHARVDTVAQGAASVSAAGLTARWMVAADGLHSLVRRRLGVTAKAGTPKRFGVRRHYRIAPWSEFVEVWWGEAGEAYVTPVSADLIGVALLGPSGLSLEAFPELAARLARAEVLQTRGAGPLRCVVSRRVRGRVLFVGDSAGYEDALTGEGISLAVKQAAAAVRAIEDDDPAAYETAWRRVTRDYRVLTRGLVLATVPAAGRRAIVPLAARLPRVFGMVVNRLAR